MKKRNKKNNKKLRHVELGYINFPVYLIPLVIVTTVTIVYMTIQTATSGAKLSNMEDKEIKLRQQNNRLYDELVMQSSLSKIANQAEDLGFQKPEMVVYTNVDEAVAKLP